MSGRNRTLPAATAAPTQPWRRIFARTVGSYVPKLTRKAFEKYGFSTASLLTDWSTIAGSDVAEYTAPLRLKWPRNVATYSDIEAGEEGRPGAVLILKVDPARALDVQYKAAQLLERINGYFGYRAVAEIRILQAPVEAAVAGPPKAPSQALKAVEPVNVPELAGIADAALREALTRLKTSVESRSQAA